MGGGVRMKTKGREKERDRDKERWGGREKKRYTHM